MVEQLATSEPSPYRAEHCDGCKAPIVWASTDKGSKMPVDAAPVDPNKGGGNVTLTERPGMLPLARVHSNPATLFGVKTVYRSHFATCPFAARYRTRGRRS